MEENISYPIEYLTDEKNRFTINKFLYNVLNKSSPATKLQLQIASKGCKYWQLIIGILIVLQKRLSNYNKPINSINILKSSNETTPVYNKLVEICRRVIKNIEYVKRAPFYDFFYNNIGNELVKEFMDNSQLKEGMNYLCIYDQNKNSDARHISHYFMIIKKKEEYTLTSSYGSDLVCVPYSTRRLDIMEFSQFLGALHDITILNLEQNRSKNWERIRDFYGKYFFEGNIPVSLDKELKEFYGVEFFKGIKGTRLIKGPELETSYVFKNKDNNSFHIGIVPDYEIILDEYTSTIDNINFNELLSARSVKLKYGGRVTRRKNKVTRTHKRKVRGKKVNDYRSTQGRR